MYIIIVSPINHSSTNLIASTRISTKNFSFHNIGFHHSINYKNNYHTKKYDVFISYRKKTVAYADLLYYSLISEGINKDRIFLDKHTIGPEQFDVTIKQAINNLCAEKWTRTKLFLTYKLNRIIPHRLHFATFVIEK